MAAGETTRILFRNRIQHRLEGADLVIALADDLALPGLSIDTVDRLLARHSGEIKRLVVDLSACTGNFGSPAITSLVAIRERMIDAKVEELVLDRPPAQLTRMLAMLKLDRLVTVRPRPA